MVADGSHSIYSSITCSTIAIALSKHINCPGRVHLVHFYRSRFSVHQTSRYTIMTQSTLRKYVVLQKTKKGKTMNRKLGRPGLCNIIRQEMEEIENSYPHYSLAWVNGRGNYFEALSVISRLAQSGDVIALACFICLLRDSVREKISNVFSKTWNKGFFQILKRIEFSAYAFLAIVLDEEQAKTFQKLLKSTNPILHCDFYLELVEYKNRRMELIYWHGLLSLPTTAAWGKLVWSPEIGEKSICELYDWAKVRTIQEKEDEHMEEDTEDATKDMEQDMEQSEDEGCGDDRGEDDSDEEDENDNGDDDSDEDDDEENLIPV